MKEIFANKNTRLVLKLILIALPLFGLYFSWTGVEGVKLYSGIFYAIKNKTLCVLGLIFIVNSLFSKFKIRIRCIYNIAGYLMFWLPMFYRAFRETPVIENVKPTLLISLALVLISIALELFIIIREDKLSVE